MCGGPVSRKSMDADEAKWRAEDDLRTLERADELRADKGRFRAALTHGRSKLRSMKRVIGASGRSSSRARARTR